MKFYTCIQDIYFVWFNPRSSAHNRCHSYKKIKDKPYLIAGKYIIIVDVDYPFSGQYNQFLRDSQKLVERVNGIIKFQDLLLAVRLEVRHYSSS